MIHSFFFLSFPFFLASLARHLRIALNNTSSRLDALKPREITEALYVEVESRDRTRKR